MAHAAPSVLLVAGAYHPEISAAGLQCQAVAAALRGRVHFSVLVTAVDPALPSFEIVDGVAVSRVGIDVRSAASKAAASIRLVSRLAAIRRTVDLIHVHGVSQKNVPVAVMGRLLGKPMMLTMHTAGQDEPQSAAQRIRFSRWAFQSVDLALSVSPYLTRRYTEAGLPASGVRTVPNGVDTTRFRPPSPDERAALRRELEWPDAEPVVLFVGFFSRDKRPDLLFRAWRRVAMAGASSRLVFVGATGGAYYEVDRSLADTIRSGAAAMGRARDVVFVEPTTEIERYFRAADLFVLPSVREAHPVALLEAMACGLPCVASRLEGATDVIIDDGVTGRLVAPDDELALSGAVTELLGNPAGAREMGQRAREAVLSRYDIRETAERWLDAYREVLTR